MRRIYYYLVTLSHVLRYSYENKAWWMVVLTGVFIFIGLLMFTAQISAPFIYTLF